MAAPTLTSTAGSDWTDNAAVDEVTGTLTWNAGDRVLVVGFTEDQSFTLNTPTATGLTFAALGTAITTGSSCWIHAWEATAAGSGSSAVTATRAGTTTVAMRGIQAYAFGGSTGFVRTNGAAVDSTQTVSVTRTQANSMAVFWSGDFSAGGTGGLGWTPAGQTQQVAQNNASHAGAYVAYWGDQGATGTTSYGTTGLAGTTFSKSAVEVLGTATSEDLGYVPFYYWPGDGPWGPENFVPITYDWTQPPDPAPPWVFSFTRHRRPGLRQARPRVAAVTPPQVVSPLVYPPPAVRPRLRGIRLSRPRAAQPPPLQDLVVQPPRPRVRPARTSRPKLAAPVPVQLVTPPPYPPQGVRSRLRFLRGGRSRAATPVPAQIVLIAPAYPPPAVRTRLRGLRLFRGRAATVVPPQIVLVAPPFVPLPARARLRALFGRRPRAAAPLLEQPLVPTPVHPRVRPAVPRRTRSAGPVPPQVSVIAPAYPPRPVRARLKGLRLTRGRAAAPTPPQVILIAPPFRPTFARMRRFLAGLWRGTAVSPVAEICDCQTHRPNTGTTLRPGSGMTFRPSSGTTSRPGSGLTARPDTGTTARPCSCGND